MAASIPPAVVLKEFLGATTRHTRRIEIYESDAVTRWEKDTELRLKDGSVTVDYARDERRALDLTLANDDGVLVNAPEEFWYDKIIKVFRGVQVNEKHRPPSVLVIAEPTGADLAATAFRAALVALGFGNVRVTTLVTTLVDFEGADILVNLNVNDAPTIALLKQAYNLGQRVLSLGYGSVEYYGDLFGVPAPATGPVLVDATTAVVPSGGHPASRGWAGFKYEMFSRVNYATDPHAETASWRTTRGYGSGGAGSYSFVTGANDGPLSDITTYRRKTWTTASTSNNDSGFEIALNNGNVATDKFPVKPGQRVTVSGWLRSSSAKTGYARAQFYNEANASSGTIANGTQQELPPNQWVRVSQTFSATDNAGRYVLYLDVVNATGQPFWQPGDTLDATGLLVEFGSVVGDITKTNYCINPSFSVDLEGWEADYGTGAGTYTQGGGNGYVGYGYGRLRFTTATTTVSGGQTFVATNLTPGTRYTISGYVRGSHGQRYRIEVVYLNGEGVQIGSVNGFGATGTSNGWVRIQVTATPPTGTITTRVKFAAVAGTGGVVWAANSTMDVDGVLFDIDGTLRGYMDGDHAAGQWLGVPGKSVSVLRAIDPKPLGDFFSGYMVGVYWAGTPAASVSAEGYKETSVQASSVPESTGFTPIATTTDGMAILSAFSTVGMDRRWIMYHPTMPSALLEVNEVRSMLTAVLTWLNPVRIINHWEVQIGEFMIDRVSEPNFPYEVKLTGRDYAKKCMSSKFAHATQFTEGMALESVIAAIAGAAGITKRNLPVTNVIVDRAFFFERGVSRWEAMKEIANAHSHEIFFDASGYLTMRVFNDPTTTAPAFFIKTGPGGTVGKYEKSTSDARIFNHILVIGESSDTSTPNIYAERINTDPNSPTSVQRIGDRYTEFTSAFITSQQQADDLADSLQAINALEEYELSFDSLMLPWMEGGDIIGWEDPRPAPGDPDRFLLSTISLPLTLSPMSCSAKRITVVGG